MACEVRGRLRRSGPSDVRGRCNQKPVRDTDPPCHGRGTREVPNADRNVHDVGDQILPLVTQYQLDTQVRMLREEPVEPWHDLAKSERQGSRDAQASPELARAARAVIGLVERGED